METENKKEKVKYFKIRQPSFNYLLGYVVSNENLSSKYDPTIKVSLQANQAVNDSD